MSTRFGWCLDGRHKLCRLEATTGVGVVLTCSCDCHDETEAADGT